MKCELTCLSLYLCIYLQRNIRLRMLIISVFILLSFCWHIYFIFFNYINLRNIPYAVISLAANILFVNFFPVFGFASFAAILFEDYIADNAFLKDSLKIKNMIISLISYMLLFSHFILIFFLAVAKFALSLDVESLISSENSSLYFAVFYVFFVLLILANEDYDARHFWGRNYLFF